MFFLAPLARKRKLTANDLFSRIRGGTISIRHETPYAKLLGIAR